VLFRSLHCQFLDCTMTKVYYKYKIFINTNAPIKED